TRLSDGLHKYKIGEADTLICAGMGGGLMTRILANEKEKTDSFRELVLQPQSELEQFRRFLRENGYRIQDEEIVL
ncbi:MAG: class I SAM-dependent methyltransferase, partial [Lachnospiraceae bacterium]|nr:class I SAM-dependent methyltransferase [Lachnospiraceae bacterium]